MISIVRLTVDKFNGTEGSAERELAAERKHKERSTREILT
jgi:hypothetical protein